MQVCIEVPDDLAVLLASTGHDLGRVALEALGVEAYRQRRLSAYQLRKLLGIGSRWEMDTFLKEHEVYDYTVEEFEKDWANLRELRAKRDADDPAA